MSCKKVQKICRFNWIWTICISQFVHWKALYVQGTVADEQRLPQQLTFARLALLLVAAIAWSQEMLWHLSCPGVGCNTECRTNAERHRTIKNTGKYKQIQASLANRFWTFKMNSKFQLRVPQNCPFESASESRHNMLQVMEETKQTERQTGNYIQ